jgi:hypothetical protein
VWIHPDLDPDPDLGHTLEKSQNFLYLQEKITPTVLFNVGNRKKTYLRRYKSRCLKGRKPGLQYGTYFLIFCQLSLLRDPGPNPHSHTDPDLDPGQLNQCCLLQRSVIRIRVTILDLIMTALGITGAKANRSRKIPQLYKLMAQCVSELMEAGKGRGVYICA